MSTFDESIESLLMCPDTAWEAVSMASYKDSPRFKGERTKEYRQRAIMECDLTARHIARLATQGKDKELGELFGKQIREYLTALAEDMTDDQPDPDADNADRLIEEARQDRLEGRE